MYIFILLIFFLKISINIAFPSSENLFNNSNSYGLEIESEYKFGGFDFNGDGIQDFITSHYSTKKTYVFFGDIYIYGDQRPLKVSMIDGINGFSIDINQSDLRNFFICGDLNNDGYDEIIFRMENCQLKIIYGHAGPFKNDFSTFDGNDGFVIDYVNSPLHPWASYQVLCDHNGDGINDLIFNTVDDVYVLYGLNRKKFPTDSGKFDINFVSNGTFGHIMQMKNTINFGCGDLNNDGIDDLVILSNKIGSVNFGLKSFPTQYNPVLNGTNGFTIDIMAYFHEYINQSGFGDFNGDGLIDMAVIGTDLKSIYMIYGKKGGIWESHFDINSGNSSEVVKWVRDISSPQEFCDSMYVGDINGDGLSDISCNVFSKYTWGVYGSTMKLPAVYDLNIKTSPLFGDCRGFILLQTAVTFSAWTDFNYDGIPDLIIQFTNLKSFILFGEKTKISASLNIINSSIGYNSNGEYHFLDSNFNPISSGNCNVQFITFKVLDSIDASDLLSFSSSNSTSSDVVSISNGELQVFNTNRDPNFLQSLSNVLFKTNRDSSIVTVSITYLNIINDTIKIFISHPTINTTSTNPATVTTTTSTPPITATASTGTTTTGTPPITATASTGTPPITATASTGTTTTGTPPITTTAITSTVTTGTTTTRTPPITTTTSTSTATTRTTTTSTVTSTHVQQNNTVNNDCICIRGQICLPNSHICVNQFDVYQGESCFQLSCALGYDCIEQSNQIYKCVKKDSCITCADITCKSPHHCILALTTSQKCKYQPTCSN
ncbi:tenascin X [Tieghemostelium lacteum]|uniref:Tenascin X n=1 Tax=Tieghemostelium lacteum TaxID=361077 RepID=A0A151ZJK2_TIELA|nr:tenascin X [Tieghemostelium lacteum]|eukprot:KYQ94178.1 tenascin X [Tieghemostelium lacteum]